MTCGNQIREGIEECDGTDLAGSTCADFVAGGVGTLGCNPVTCSYDTSLCTIGAGGAGNGTGGAGG